MTMLLVVSVGCCIPAAVRAEAPTPRGGCWPREIAMRSSENSQAIMTIKGRVIAIEHNRKNQQIAAKELVTWVRIKTTNGAEKSIYLGSSQSLNQQSLKIQVRDVLEVQGVQTLKARQLPTIIASTVKKGDQVWKIDNFTNNNKPTEAKWCRYSG